MKSRSKPRKSTLPEQGFSYTSQQLDDLARAAAGEKAATLIAWRIILWPSGRVTLHTIGQDRDGRAVEHHQSI